MTALNRDESLLARHIFRAKILATDASAFEALFSHVMASSNPHFSQVKPQGRKGDKKNDGFDRTAGRYYQCWGPEDVEKSISTGTEKLKNDFAGLLAFWDKIRKVESYRYVVNDKYKGIYPDIEVGIAELQRANPSIDIAPMFTRDIEDIFIILPPHKIEDVLGGALPRPENISRIRYSSVDEIVTHVLNDVSPSSGYDRFVPPNFDNKIRFNGLSSRCGSLMTVASYQQHVIDSYFDANSTFFRDDVKERVRNCYQRAKGVGDAPDTIFFMVLDEICAHSKEKHVQDAGLAVMAYYFEKCDVFEEPGLL